jgi:hypothetical protein
VLISSDEERAKDLSDDGYAAIDGSPQDALLAGVLAVPVVLTFVGTVRWIALALVTVGVLYALVRRRIPDYVEPYIE